MTTSPKQSTQKGPKGQPGVHGLKAVMTTASIAATLGGWALLSAKQPTVQASEAPTAVPPTPTPTLEPAPTFALPALPTLIPPPTVASGLAKLSTAPPATAAPPTPIPQPTLRVVSSVPPQKVVHVGGGGGGSGGGGGGKGGGGGSAPAARTGSSHP